MTRHQPASSSFQKTLSWWQHDSNSVQERARMRKQTLASISREAVAAWSADSTSTKQPCSQRANQKTNCLMQQPKSVSVKTVRLLCCSRIILRRIVGIRSLERRCRTTWWRTVKNHESCSISKKAKTVIEYISSSKLVEQIANLL